MRTNIKLLTLFCILNAACHTPSKTSNAVELIIDKTSMQKVDDFFGKEDDEFATIAESMSSGHTTAWITYKKYGLAFCSTSYTPDRTDGYQNGILRDIRIFDTTNLNVRKSEQQRRYGWGGGFTAITPSSLKYIFGNPDKIRNKDTVEYWGYKKRNIVFAFRKSSNQFLKLYVNK